MKWAQALCSSILVDGLCTQADGGDLRVDLDGDEIVVTKPGTMLMLAYAKSVEQPRLVLTRSWMKPTTSSPSIVEFRTQAFQAAGEQGTRARVDRVT
jgi:hypothetical protein